MANENFKKGLELRSSLLGKAHTEAVFASDDPLQVALQEFVTEYVYGAVWSRPGLELATRSLITIALLASQNRMDVLKQHVRAAVTTGVPRQKILEALIHVIPYCGIPAGVSAFNTAKAVFRDIDEHGAEQH
jgi:4-carboxymuconolactone decarboxylase